MSLKVNSNNAFVSPLRQVGGTFGTYRSNFNPSEKSYNRFTSQAGYSGLAGWPVGYSGNGKFSEYAFIQPLNTGGMGTTGKAILGNATVTASGARGINLASTTTITIAITLGTKGKGVIGATPSQGATTTLNVHSNVNLEFKLTSNPTITITGQTPAGIHSSITGSTTFTVGLSGKGVVHLTVPSTGSVTAHIASVVQILSHMTTTSTVTAGIKAPANLNVSILTNPTVHALVHAAVNIISHMSQSATVTIRLMGGVYGHSIISVTPSTVTSHVCGKGVINTHVAIPFQPTALEVAEAVQALIGDVGGGGGTGGSGPDAATIAEAVMNAIVEGAVTLRDAQVQIYNQSMTSTSGGSGGTVTDPLNEIIENGLTLKQVQRILLAVAAGKSTIVDNGNGTKTVTFRDQTNTVNRLSATVNCGVRSSVIENIE